MALEAPDLGSANVVASIDDGVLHVRIDRPDRRNSFTQEMYRSLKRAAVWADRQPELDVVCLTGTDEWFGAGGDLSRPRDAPDLQSEWDSTDHFPFRHIERCRKIWLAKINGVCHAGGVDLLLHCDVTIASNRARFRLPELLRGLPDPHMSARLVASVGLARARYMIFTASELTAQEAFDAGLIGAVVPHDDLDERVSWAIERIKSTGPGARAALKREINSRFPAADMGLFSQVSSEEMREGMASFVDKRDPVWRA